MSDLLAFMLNLTEWPRGSVRRWLLNLGIWAVIVVVLYLAFTWLGRTPA